MLVWKNFLLIFLFFFVQKVRADQIITNYYYAEEGDSLKSILEKDIGLRNNLLYGVDKYFEKIKSWNDHIEDFDNLKPGDEIYVEYPASARKRPVEVIVDEREITDDKELTRYNQIVDIDEPEEPEKENHLSIFFAASQGTFREKTFESNTTVNSNQNSPVTVGLLGTTKYNPSVFLSYSIYLSQLTASLESSQSQLVSIPTEIGVNFYGNFKIEDDFGFIPYAGFDVERFSTFNSNELALSIIAPVEVRSHMIGFVTAGVSKMVSFFGDKNMLLKLSLSRSIYTQTDLTDDKPFIGNKFIVFSALRITNSFSITGFVKQHRLEGPTEMVTTRYGLGFSYSLY